MATKKKTAVARKSKGDLPGGKALRKAVAKAVKKAQADLDVAVVDVTAEVMAAVEKPKRQRRPKDADRRVVEAPTAVVEETTPDVVGVGLAEKIAANVEAQAKQDAEERAAIAVYAYAERLGIDVADVVRVSQDAGEYDTLLAEAGAEITDVVVWLAAQKARQFDTKYVRPFAPSTGRRAAKAERAAGEAAGGSGKARVQVFGHAATAVIRALRATCGMDFTQIRSVLNAMGADSVADATIRAQMAGGGLTRGEPAPLTEKQIDDAKDASGLVTA